MPPNLGGVFMVRSYYTSECHADYFDFERIEALKPAIEACGISSLSQCPMLGCHKHRDNRIFFFSSRRRHTRLQGDWSSDVCSSDLSTSPRCTKYLAPFTQSSTSTIPHLPRRRSRYARP